MIWDFYAELAWKVVIFPFWFFNEIRKGLIYVLFGR
jgi:hypothetical protein